MKGDIIIGSLLHIINASFFDFIFKISGLHVYEGVVAAGEETFTGRSEGELVIHTALDREAGTLLAVY